MASNADLQYQITVNGISETITSIADLEKRVKELSVAWKACSTSVQAQTVALTDYRNAQATLVTALKPATQGMQNMTGVSANAGMALLNLNYVIRDSPYFFNNFAMGVLAVGNNLNPLIDSFSRLKKEAIQVSLETGKATSTFALLKQAMVGGAGISIAFSLIVTAIQSFVFYMSKANRETKDQTEALKKQKEEVSHLRSEYNSLAKERGLFMKEDLSKETLDNLNKQYNTALKIKDEYQAEFDLYERISKKTGVQSEQYKEAKKNLDAENAALGIIYSKIEAITFINNKALETDKEKTKQLKEQKKIIEEIQIIQFRTAQELFDFETKRTFRDPRQERWNVLDEMFNKKKEKAGAGTTIKDSMKEFNIALETGKIFANQLGDALNEAFTQGTLSIKKFIEALISAIAQMLILRAITAFLTGGASMAGSAVPGIPAVMPKGLGKGNAIRVTGQITADKNNFIANIRNADNYFKKNEEFVLIGR